MFKKTLILVSLLIAGMNISVRALPQSKSVSNKNSGAPVVLQTRPSKAELQKCVKEARAYIANLRKMGYSTQEIQRIVAEQIGVTAGLTEDFYEGHVTTKTMWILLASAVVASSVVGVVGVAAGYVGDMLWRNSLSDQERQTRINEDRRRYHDAFYR